MSNDEQRRAFLDALSVLYDAVQAAPVRVKEDALTKALGLSGIRMAQALGEAFFDMVEAQQSMALSLERLAVAAPPPPLGFQPGPRAPRAL